MPANDTRFKKGQSGNPKGRPKGLLNKTTLAAQVLLDGEAEALTRKAIEKAKEGDIAALKLCLERIVPPRKERALSIALPRIEKTGDTAKILAAVLDAVACGDLTPGEGQVLASMAETYRRAIETADLDRRVEALEMERGKW